MENFKIEEHGSRYYIVPTATFLLTYEVKTYPFDTNFLIYKMFDYEPKEFIQFLCGSCEARVEVLKEFPYINFSFSKYISAANFVEILNKRSNIVQENLI